MTAPHRQYRIGLDCRLSGWRHAGIGRYISNLASRLPSLQTQTTWVYFVYDLDQETELFPDGRPTNVEVRVTPIHHYSLAEQLQLPRIFSQAKLDLLHVPHFNLPLLYQGLSVVTIHDLLWHHHRGSKVTTLSGWKYWLKYLGYRSIVRQAVTKAALIFVPTETTAQTVKSYYPQTQSKLVISPEGVDTNLATDAWPAKVTQTTALGSKELLYVGSLYPHKNIDVVLQALKSLPEYHLTLVGARSVFQTTVEAQVQAANLTKQVTFAGFVPDSELRQLYQQSLALIQPSLSEGFGLTGLEALAAGGRVIASDIAIFHEVYGDLARFFDPHSPESLVEAITQLSHQQSPSPQSVESWLQRFSWDEMAQTTLDSYFSVLHD